MKQIISTSQVGFLAQEILAEGKKIVVVGGCFDVFHKGHALFLNAAKEKADILVLLLESDEAVKERKGEDRPINSQRERALNLLSKSPVDIIINLEYPTLDSDYDSLVTSLKPAIIATTIGDPYIEHKERQASTVGAKVLEVIKRIPDFSTTDSLKKQL